MSNRRLPKPTPYVIEKGIPIPPNAKTGKPHVPASPIKQMLDRLEIDESFFVPKEDRNRVGSAATDLRALSGKRFTIRMWQDGYRVWRVGPERGRDA